MSLIHADCIEAMAAMEAESVDAICTDPPYGIGFMGKAWDELSADPVEASWSTRGRNDQVRASEFKAGVATSRTGFPDPNPRCANCGRAMNGRDTAKGFKVCHCEKPTYAPTPNRSAQRSQQWHQRWAEAAYRVAKPSAYLLAFGGTRTVHRMTVAIEDAGWIIRDMLVWAYASGFPKSKASLKPAWEPIVMARKPGPLRELAIDACRIEAEPGDKATFPAGVVSETERVFGGGDGMYGDRARPIDGSPLGRWPANLVLTDPIFDGGWDGVVGGGETPAGAFPGQYDRNDKTQYRMAAYQDARPTDSGTYSRFFLIPKADRADREPVLGGLPERFRGTLSGESTPRSPRDGQTRNGAVRANVHPTVKPVDLMRHLVRLVTPTGGIVLDPFAGSGSTLLAAEQEGFEWIGIEKEAEYVAIAEARLNGTQRGLGLPA